MKRFFCTSLICIVPHPKQLFTVYAAVYFKTTIGLMWKGPFSTRQNYSTSEYIREVNKPHAIANHFSVKHDNSPCINPHNRQNWCYQQSALFQAFICIIYTEIYTSSSSQNQTNSGITKISVASALLLPLYMCSYSQKISDQLTMLLKKHLICILEAIQNKLQ